MGRKFQSFHVMQSNEDAVSLLLANCQLDKQLNGGIENDLPEHPLNSVEEILEFLSHVKEETAKFYLTSDEQGSTVSVFSDYFQSHPIHEYLNSWLSDDFGNVILSIDYWDDDVLEIQIFHKASLVTSLVAGNSVELYG